MNVTDDMRRAVPLLKAVLELVEGVDKLNSIEQAVAESEARLARARAAESELKAKFVAEREDIAAQRQGAAAACAQATADAASIIESAEDEAERILSEARGARDAQDAALEVHKASVAKLEQEFAVANARLAEIKAETQSFEDALKQKRAALAAELQHFVGS